MNDLFNIELVNDNLKKFGQPWENILLALDKDAEDDHLEGLYLRQLEKSSSVQNPLALCHSDQVHRKELKSYWRLRAVVSNDVGRPAAKFSENSKRERLDERQSKCDK